MSKRSVFEDDEAEVTTDPRSFYVPEPDGPAVTPAPVPPPPPAPAPAPPPPPGPPSTRRRFRWGRLVLGLVAVVLVLGLLGMGVAWQTFRSVERVELGDTLASGGPFTNYLIVGTDSREGVDADVENSGAIFGEGVSGERTDTMVVLQTGGGTSRMMAIPRDLLVRISGSGAETRINAAFREGPEVLVQTIRDNLGIPIHHYFEVDFAGFLGLVDAVGGVPIEFPHPAFDEKSGLDVPMAGTHVLDADEALAYVRSRTYTEIVDGQPRTDPTADLGRVDRQQQFLRSLFGEVGDTRNPVTLLRIGRGLADDIRIDSRLGFWEAAGLIRRLGGLNPETIVLPTSGTSVNGASVLVLADADDELDLFR